MELDEYMASIMEWAIELDDCFSDEDLDNIDFTIRSVIRQMGWSDSIRFISE